MSRAHWQHGSMRTFRDSAAFHDVASDPLRPHPFLLSQNSLSSESMFQSRIRERKVEIISWVRPSHLAAVAAEDKL